MRRLYRTARWEAIRQITLAEQPLCRRCDDRGVTTPSSTVHHNPGHGGDPDRFWDGPFEALCTECHDGPAKREELDGYSPELGSDGWPDDPRHPANRVRP